MIAFFPLIECNTYSVLLFRFKANLPTREELREELRQLQVHLEELNVPLVMCHNDVWGRNVVYDQENGNKGHRHSVDFEIDWLPLITRLIRMSTRLQRAHISLHHNDSNAKNYRFQREPGFFL